MITDLSPAVLDEPGLIEATAIEHDYERALKGLRAYVSMGLRLMDVKARLPHGKYLPWCETYLPRISKPHLHRAKFIAEGLCEKAGIKCLPRETFDDSLPEEIETFVEGASGYRALMAGIQEFRQDSDETAARETCMKLFAADAELRDEWEPRALSGELPWTLVLRGIKGQEATAGKKRSDPDYAILIFRSVTTVRNGFAKWGELPEQTQDEAIIALKQLVSEMPAAVRAAIGLK